MIAFICGLFDSVIRGSSAIISEIRSSMSVSLERLRRSMHFDSISPLLRTYSRVMPGGKYLINIFLSFIQINTQCNYNIISDMSNDDPRLNLLIREGADGDIVIVGAPFDYARKTTISKGGEENGPCCLRRFIPKVGPLVNPEYGISIKDVKVTDFGNVDIEDKNSSSAPERAITKIATQICQLVKYNRLPFVFGGSKEGTYGASLGFKQCYQNGRHILIAGKSTLRRPEDKDKLNSDNLMSLLTKSKTHNLTVFSPSSLYFQTEYAKNFEIISHEQIRGKQFKESQFINTQGGYAMRELLNRYTDQKIHVTLSVEAIQRFKGCRDVLAFGLTVEEIVEIFFLMGMSSNVLLVDICEFNPSVEDYESSLLIVNLLYYFLMGWTKRSKLETK